MRGSASQRSHHAALQGLLALDRLVRRLLVGIAPLQLRRRRPLLGSVLVARLQRREVAQHLATLADRAPRAWQADRRRQRVLARGGSDEQRELAAAERARRRALSLLLLALWSLVGFLADGAGAAASTWSSPTARAAMSSCSASRFSCLARW